MMVAETVPQGRREEARAYRQIRYRLTLINLAIAAGYLLVLVAGGSRWLGARLEDPRLFLLALFGGMALVSLPVDYAGHLAARRFGLSVQRTRSWLADQAKGFAFSLLFQGGLALLILQLWSSQPDTWYLWAAAVAIVGDLLMVFLFPVVIAPLFHKYTPLGDGELKNRLMALSQRTGVFVRGVFVSNVSAKQTALNASLSGLGATRRITLWDTTIRACTPDEIEVVLGHEMGHHVYGHIYKKTLLNILFIAVAFVVAGFAVEPLSLALGTGGLTKEALPLMVALFILMALPLVPAVMAVSRQYERDCDAYAFQVTGKPEAFISFFRKVADRNLADFNPPRWVYYFQYSHPPVPERIAAAEAFSRSKQG